MIKTILQFKHFNPAFHFDKHNSVEYSETAFKLWRKDISKDINKSLSLYLHII